VNGEALSFGFQDLCLGLFGEGEGSNVDGMIYLSGAQDFAGDYRGFF
jgi:hypothetical protein